MTGVLQVTALNDNPVSICRTRKFIGKGESNDWDFTVLKPIFYYSEIGQLYFMDFIESRITTSNKCVYTATDQP